MRYKVQVGGREHEVEITETANGFTARVGDGDARPVRLVPSPAPLHVLELGETRAAVALVPVADEPGRWQVALAGRPPVEVEAVDARFAKVLKREGAGARRLKKLKSPMPGVIVELHVEPGQEVTKGQVLLILEAMKMQNEIRAEGDGTVKAVKVAVGDSVPAGGLLIDFG
jgi:biotin carboxyl carrier protein